MPSILKLSALKKGQSAKIISFEKDYLKLKFYEMGCIPGEKITLEMIAPMGDPIAINIGGYLLSLRRQDAQYIKVEVE